MCKPLLALVALLLIPSELEAKDEAKPPLQFTVLEDDYQWNNDIEKARTTLAREIQPNISPGSRSTISVAGTRLSEQPIQK